MRHLSIDWTQVFRPKGCIVAIPVKPEVASKLVLSGGESADELHATLLFFPEEVDLNLLSKICSKVAENFTPFYLSNNGIGRFYKDDGDVIYLDVDCPEIHILRDTLAAFCDDNGIDYSKKFDFNPHITLAYVDQDVPTPTLSLDSSNVTIFADSIEIWNNGSRFNYPLG